ncbi:MAG: CcdB family protein [Rhizobiaceae bacterium]|nr:CcdB family protein [Rhizobiaceae bacterium]
MARYDLYPDGEDYLLDVQADTLEGLNTRVVVPVRVPARAPKPARRLNPTFQLNGSVFLMVTQFMAAVPEHELGQPHDNLGRHHDEIVAALDMLFHGF